jgi:hypothetical protein
VVGQILSVVPQCTSPPARKPVTFSPLLGSVVVPRGRCLLHKCDQFRASSSSIARTALGRGPSLFRVKTTANWIRLVSGLDAHAGGFPTLLWMRIRCVAAGAAELSATNAKIIGRCGTGLWEERFLVDVQ